MNPSTIRAKVNQMQEHLAVRPIPATLVDLLRQQAERYGDKVAFRFSYNGDGEDESRLTYRELDARARSIAAGLQHEGAVGQRVLVICRPGLDVVVGVFGCLYAGAVAVPVHQKLAPRLTAVVPDAHASFALATADTQANVRAGVDSLVNLVEGRPLRWSVPDAPVKDAEKWVVPDIDADTTAMMQYTSGSTRSPSGVMLTHRNLLHNLEAVRQTWHGDERDVCVFWLPPHHDMGLIGGHFNPLYLGCTTVLMSPAAFIKRPMRWLEAISRNRGTYTTAPNFAYELCVARSTGEERAALELSHWSTAMNGAEPVRAATLRAFAEAFAPAGFRPEAFMPVYGLAEATLLVSGGSESAVPVVDHIDRAALEADRVVDAAPDHPTAVPLVGCGRPQGGQRVAIVDPETKRERGIDEVGEIWIAGPSVARGYWGKPDETAQTFSAYLAETGEGPFLRTGDLGFLRRGELFIIGRCKDLVVIRDAKYYPNDIEATVQDCHPAFVSGRGAVFAVTPEDGAVEQLVVVQEVEGHGVDEAKLHEMVDAAQTAIGEHHGLQAHALVLVEHLRIPTTSSGKIQRGACRQQFLDRKFETVAEWYAPASPPRARDLKAARLAEILEDTADRRRRAARP